MKKFIIYAAVIAVCVTYTASYADNMTRTKPDEINENVANVNQLQPNVATSQYKIIEGRVNIIYPDLTFETCLSQYHEANAPPF